MLAKILLYGMLLVVPVIFGAVETVTSGVTYEHKKLSHPELLSIHILEVNPEVVRIGVQHAYDGGLTREPVSHIAKRVGAIAAVNGSNYRRGGTFNGNSTNFLKIEDKIYADPQLTRASIGWSKERQELYIGQMMAIWGLSINEIVLPIDRVNQPRGAGEAIVYTDAFNRTTLTDNQGFEIIIADNKVVGINENFGNSEIPKGGLVYSVGDKKGISLSEVKLDMPVSFSHAIYPLNIRSLKERDAWQSMDYIVGGAGWLVSDGKLVNIERDLTMGKQLLLTADEAAADFHQESERKWFTQQKHPRTALGVRSNGRWVFVVVEGRNDQTSVGMTLPELAFYMQSLGCVDAINLGGGGCSTMFVDGQVKSNCSGSTWPGIEKGERPVAEAITIFCE